MSASLKHNRPDFRAAIALFRDIAARSGDAMLTEGPVNPDHRLLDVCAQALHHCTGEAQAGTARRNLDASPLYRDDPAGQAAYRTANDQLYASELRYRGAVKPRLVAIAKLKATTPALLSGTSVA